MEDTQSVSNSDNILQGIFKYEIKNRFLCQVNVAGEDVICYIPSSCRLSNFLDLTNRKVLLKTVNGKKSKTKYSVYAVEYKKSYILLNLSQTNRIIENQINRRYFSFLGKRKNVIREAVIAGYKSDLFVKDSNTIIEIKSILSFDKETKFPSMYSKRALKQLSDISELLEKGYNVCYIFVSLNSNVKSLVIDVTKTNYFDLFSKCIEKGMVCHGFSLKFIDGEPKIHSKLQINLKTLNSLNTSS